jgi:hypothetical protein
MSADNPQWRIQQRTEEDVAAFRVRIMNRAVIPERNVIRTDLLVAPLDNINEIIQTYHWGYLHNCACVVHTRLVQLFYAKPRSCKMMTMALSYSLPLTGILLWLILRLSARSLECQYSRFLPARTMKLFCPRPWRSSWNSFILPLRVRSDLLPSRSVLCLPRTTC